MTEEALTREFANFNFNEDEKDLIVKAFQEMDERGHGVDKDGNGFIDKDEIGDFLALVNCTTAQYKIRRMLEESDLDKDNKISVPEFLKMYETLTKNKIEKEFKAAVRTKQGIKKASINDASNTGTQHSYSEEETAAFTGWIMRTLKDDNDCKEKCKNLEGDNLFEGCNDGVLLCKLINKSAPDTIDERTINKTKLNIYRITENLNLALNSASSIGCNIINMSASEIHQGKPHLVLGLLWQVIRIGLFSKIDLFRTPELAALLRDGEELEDLMNLSPDELLLRWMNYHLANSKTYQAIGGKEVTNFSGDIKDSRAYACLLEQIQPRDEETNEYTLIPAIGSSDVNVSDDMQRAENVLKSADRMNCREFVTATDIVKGNSKLNMAFVANLFNTYPALNYDQENELVEETREVKTFRNWMNSLGVSPRVNKFGRDLQDGMVLLQLQDKVKEGCVDWNKVNKPPYKIAANMRKIENCQTAIKISLNKLGHKIVSIDGNDIYNANEKLTLAVVWQIMRSYTLNILERCSYDGKAASDPEIVDWVNKTLEEGGKSTRIKNFKDKSISNSEVVLDLIDCIVPDTVNYELIITGELTEEDKRQNAKLALSLARKIGARVYALPEDLVEVNPKMVLTVFACLMGRGLDEVSKPETPAE